MSKLKGENLPTAENTKDRNKIVIDVLRKHVVVAFFLNRVLNEQARKQELHSKEIQLQLYRRIKKKPKQQHTQLTLSRCQKCES